MKRRKLWRQITSVLLAAGMLVVSVEADKSVSFAETSGFQTEAEAATGSNAHKEEGGIPATGSNSIKKQKAPAVKEGSVAAIGDQGYGTLSEAFAAAKTGDVIKLLATVENQESVKIDKGRSLTLDLNGNDISFALKKRFDICGGRLEIEGEGTVKEAEPYFGPVILKGAEAPVPDFSVIIIGEDVTLEGWSGVFIDTTSAAANGAGYGIQAVVYGTIRSVEDIDGGVGHGIYVNGSIQTQGEHCAQIVVDENAKVTSKGYGMYLAGYAETTIGGNAEVSGEVTGIELRAGKLTVVGEPVISGSMDEFSVKPEGNGATTCGAGIAVAQHSTKQPIEVNISGGTISGYAALYESNPQKNGPEAVEQVELSITGGQFTGADGAAGPVYSEKYEGSKTGFIAGGSFSAKLPDEYCEDGFAVVENGDGTFGVEVEKPAALVGEKGYVTLQAAVDAVASGTAAGTIVLCADIAEDIVIPENAAVTLELNGYTIRNQKDHTIYNCGMIEITGEGVIDNVSHGKAAFYNEAGAYAALAGGAYLRSREAGSSATESGKNSFYNLLNHGKMEIFEGVTVRQDGGFSSLVENGWQNGSQNLTGELSELTIYGGTFSGGLNTIKNDDFGYLVIKGGTFKNVAQASILNWNQAKISGGTFTVAETARSVILNGYLDDEMDQGLLTITGGTFTAAHGKNVIETMGGASHSGSIKITGGTFRGKISVSDHGTTEGRLTISGGSFSEKILDEHCAEGFAPVQNADGTFTAAKPNLTISIDRDQIYRGESAVITATVVPAGQELTWKVSPGEAERAVELKAEGNTAEVKGIEAMEGIVITAMAPGGLMAECTLSILPQRALLEPGSLSLKVGETKAVKAVETEPEGKLVSWVSKDPAIAAVDGLGNVTGLQEGTTEIEAMIDGYPAGSCFVTVEKKEIPARPSRPSKPKGSGGGGYIHPEKKPEEKTEGQWVQYENRWWYQNGDGTWPADCWVQLPWNGEMKWYHFDAQGYLTAGWFTDVDQNRYFLHNLPDGNQGYMYTGWKQIDGSWYYFREMSGGPLGSLLVNGMAPGGYGVDENGRWIQ